MTDNYGRGGGAGRPRSGGYETQAYSQGFGATGRSAGGAPDGGHGGGTSPNGVRIDHAQFAAGAAATALVAAVAGFVITVIIQAIYTQHAIGSAWGGGPQDPWASAVLGGVGALIAGVLLWVFLSLVPSPMTFFRWIAGLFIVASVVLPFLSGTDWVGRLITALLNAFLGILVVSLLTAVATKTTDVDTH